MNLKDKKVISATALILVIVALFVFRSFQKGDVSIVYKTAKVDRGDILSYVAATGTINPVTMVEIRGQISGTIKDVYVDFNSRVKKGEVLAEIGDPVPFKAKVDQPEAGLKKAQVDS